MLAGGLFDRLVVFEAFEEDRSYALGFHCFGLVLATNKQGDVSFFDRGMSGR